MMIPFFSGYFRVVSIFLKYHPKFVAQIDAAVLLC